MQPKATLSEAQHNVWVQWASVPLPSSDLYPHENGDEFEQTAKWFIAKKILRHG